MALRAPKLLALLLALCLADPSAATVVIDNFEQGAISVIDGSDTPGVTFQEQSGLDTANVVGGVRLAGATATGEVGAPGSGIPGTATALLAPLPLVPDAVLFESTTAGTFNFFYDGNADGAPQTTDGALDLDLTGRDAFLVSVLATLGTPELRVTVWDSDSNSNSAFHVAANGANIIPFSEFSGIDFTDVQTIRLAVSEVVSLNAISISEFLAVPEPGTALLLAAGLVGLTARRRMARQGRSEAPLQLE